MRWNGTLKSGEDKRSARARGSFSSTQFRTPNLVRVILSDCLSFLTIFLRISGLVKMKQASIRIYVKVVNPLVMFPATD